jgi:FMN phosphatase YigB (HAD superfamily)
MAHEPIRLICLDLGGVLIRVGTGWAEVCTRAGLALPTNVTRPEIAARIMGLGRECESGTITQEAFDEQAARAAGIAAADLDAIAGAWLRGPYPGAFELVGDLSARSDICVACLSNTNPRHWRMMTTPGSPHDLGLHRLHRRFLSYEIGRMKPAEPVYRHVEAATGITPRSILFFDDNADNVKAARLAGWNAELIDPCGDPPAEVRRWLTRYGLH